MKTRIISAIVMLPLLILVYLGGIWLKMAVVIISVIGLDEFYKGFNAEGVKPSFPIGIASVILLHIFHTINAQMGAEGPDSGVLYALWLFIVVVACMIYGFKVEERKTEDMASTALGIIYVPFLFHFAVLIDECDYAKNYIWLVFIIAFGTDIFAYFSGVFLGKHKLCPTLSPKKTVEGAIGGMIGALVFSLLFGNFFLEPGHAFNARFIIMILIGSIVSMLGDLSASAFKRQMGIKDYGNLIPGHGGILDRFDSVLFVAPYLYFYIALVLPGII
ncbi:MAG: phosphatidate cytidylyltransferase [Clostridiales bacterium]|nr:phosphatidate cytidylyltransferase [Clostridiales bacterium]